MPRLTPVQPANQLRRLAEKWVRDRFATGGSARATHVEFLDGDAMWILVVGVDPGMEPALRSRTSQELVVPDFHPTGRAHDSCAGTMDLLPHASVISVDPEGHELVLVGARGLTRPVAWGGHRPDSPIKIGTSSDGRWRFLVSRDESLVVRARRTVLQADVRAMSMEGNEVVVSFFSPVPPSRVTLVDKSGAEKGDLVMETSSDGNTVRFGAEHVQIPPGTTASFEVVHAGGRLPLRRQHLDLREPSSSVVLPRLTGDLALGRASIRVGYRRDGQLTVRRRAQPQGPTLS